jgi:NAD-dependent DNA ligase
VHEVESHGSGLVAFTGESGFALGGVQLDRTAQECLATKAGCRTWPRITKQVELCVASRPEQLTGKLAKAEEYGIEVIGEADFWRGVGFNLARA